MRAGEGGRFGEGLRRWDARADWVYAGAFGVLGFLAVAKIGDELIRLTVASGPTAAIDLHLRYQEVARWFAGQPVYGAVPWIAYPPATYLLLWPFLGWLDFESARWLWAATLLPAVAGLATLLLQGLSAPETSRRDRAFVVLMLLSMNAVGVTIGNGQLVLHVLPVLLAAILLMARSDAAASDALAAAFLVAAAAKPTLAAPFLWIPLFTTRRWRPLVLAGAGYLALTWVASTFQPESFPVLMRAWLAQNRPEIAGGYGDIQSALVNHGLVSFALPASLVVFAAHGIWSYRHRHADLWTQLGIAALVARLWAYHRVYDDVLIVVPMVALFRLARQGRTDQIRDLVAGTVLAFSVLGMVLPARLETAAPPWPWVFVGAHVTAWIAMLVVLMRAAAEDSPRRNGG